MIDITTGSWKWDENGIRDRFRDFFGGEPKEAQKITGMVITASVMDHFYVPLIKKVIFNYPATIIIWNDNSKTVVKLMEGDTWDPEKGFAMAYLKKILGTQRLRKEIKTWVKPQEEQEKDCEILVNVMKNMDEYVNIGDAVSDYLKKVFKQSDKTTTDSEDK